MARPLAVGATVAAIALVAPTVHAPQATAVGAAALLADLKASDTPAFADDDGRGACPPGMFEIEGDFCPFVEQICLRWLDPPKAEPKLRCAEFRKAPGNATACHFKTEHKHFCIDEYEWPNKRGAMPAVSMNWYEAKRSCESVGKRLCGDDEWTLACEGQEHLPYPYGYARNAEACNIDKQYIFPDPFTYEKLPTRASEIARLLQSEPSGARESCVSPYGVHDMAGNVDEWVLNVTGKCTPHCSGLKGGYWGPVRTRCRPMTTAHEEIYSYYQNGFRCCSDAR